mgnify:FL=1
MPRHLKKISEETLHQNPWWTYKHDKYQLPNGQIGDYYYGETEGSVIMIPILNDGRIVLTLQHRYLMDKQSIEFPCGAINQGESSLNASMRELKEETGCLADIDNFIKIGEFESSNGLIKERMHVYIVEVHTQIAPSQDETEDIEVLYRRPDEIDEMIYKNEIWCGQTMAAWALAYRHFLYKGKL